MRNLATIGIGIIFIIGGLTGELALIGTNSGTALAVIGVFILIYGLYRMFAPRRTR